MQSDVLCSSYQLPSINIQKTNFDAPSPVQSTLVGDTMVNDGHVIHMDCVLNITKQEVLEFQPSSYTHKVANIT